MEFRTEYQPLIVFRDGRKMAISTKNCKTLGEAENVVRENKKYNSTNVRYMGSIGIETEFIQENIVMI